MILYHSNKHSNYDLIPGQTGMPELSDGFWVTQKNLGNPDSLPGMALLGFHNFRSVGLFCTLNVSGKTTYNILQLRSLKHQKPTN